MVMSKNFATEDTEITEEMQSRLDQLLRTCTRNSATSEMTIQHHDYTWHRSSILLCDLCALCGKIVTSTYQPTSHPLESSTMHDEHNGSIARLGAAIEQIK